MKKTAVYIFFLLFLNSCDKCPNYQWYFNGEIGIRICNIVLIDKDFLEIRGSVINKSSESIKIGWLNDTNKGEYCVINKNRPVSIDGEKAYRIILGGMEVSPNEEVDFYWHSYDRKNDKERYRILKKANVSESYFMTTIENFKKMNDTTIKVSY